MGVLGIKQLPEDQLLKCSSLKLENLKGNIFKVFDMIEKPKLSEIISRYSILGRCVLPSKIFSILEVVSPCVGKELQLYLRYEGFG